MAHALNNYSRGGFLEKELQNNFRGIIVRGEGDGGALQRCRGISFQTGHMACSNSFWFLNSENEPWIESSSKKKYWKTKPSPKKGQQEESF